jgi:RNA polymerase sigma factor (TIGR02999 family)
MDPSPAAQDTAQILTAIRRGDRAAADRLMPHFYNELRIMAAQVLDSERRDHTLQPTALVNEAFVRLAGHLQVDWSDRAHFLAVAARAMRRILTDHARSRAAQKRGGEWNRVELDHVVAPPMLKDVDLCRLDLALTRLSELDERQARIVELRFFAGLNVEEVARVLDLSPRTIEVEWRMARAWLGRQLTDEKP